MNIRKEMVKISARILGNTHAFPRQFDQKIDLLAEVHTTFALARDFTEWCNDRKAERLQYPIIEYLKEVDSRFGGAPDRLNLKDPRVETISALTYDKTGILPTAKAVAELLLTFTEDEITGAITEYTATLTQDDVRSAMRRFWADGGAGAVILARRNRESHGN